MEYDEDEIWVSDKEFRDWCPPSILKEIETRQVTSQQKPSGGVETKYPPPITSE